MSESRNKEAESMRLDVTFAWHTDVGKRRSSNEDAVRCDAFFNSEGLVSTLLTLSDGVGGANAGEVASKMAVDGIYELVSQGWSTSKMDDEERYDARLNEAMRQMDSRIREAGAAAGSADMGATLSVAWIIGSRAWWGQAGDSRIYLFRDATLKAITADQSPVGRLRAEGALTEAEARAHPLRNLIEQCLGGNGAPVVPVTGCLELLDNDILLICSDGLNDGLWDEEIAKGLSEVAEGAGLEAAVYYLVDDAKNKSGKDNITAIVARVKNSSPVPVG